MHLCTLVFIYSYISLSIHIPFYHLCIISFIRLYHDLVIHVFSIFLSCMLLLIHIFIYVPIICVLALILVLCHFYLSLSFLAFTHFSHVFLACSILFISVCLSYIHIMSSTCNILYLVNLYLHVHVHVHISVCFHVSYHIQVFLFLYESTLLRNWTHCN